MEIEVFLREYESGTLRITDKIEYSTREVVERSNRLKHSQFEDPFFPDGSKKLFYNVAAAVARTIYRNTDLDTKDMQIVSMNGIGVKMMPLLKMALRWFLKVTGFGTVINDTRGELIDMGHVILKHVKGKMVPVNLLNIIVPPHVESIQDSGCVEITFLTWDDIKKNKEAWADQWENVLKVKEAMDSVGEIFFTIYEYWTFDSLKPEGTEGAEEDEMKEQRICIKYMDTGIFDTAKEVKAPENIQPCEELERFATPDEMIDPLTDETVSLFPYEERRFIKIKGRYLGFGVYELLAGLQEDYNERMNMKRRLDRQSLTGILVHRMPSEITKASMLTQEFLANVDQGAVIDVEQDEDLTRLQSQFVPDFIAMIDKIFEIMRLIIGVTSQAAGEQLPGSTPATLGVINQQVAQTTYDCVIEEQALLWEQVFNKFLLKEILTKLTKKKCIAITGDATIIDDMDELYATNHLNAAIEEFKNHFGVPGINKAGKDIYFDTTSPEAFKQQYQQEKQALIDELRKQGDAKYTKIVEDMYKETETAIQFYMNNEAFDKASTIKDLLTFRQFPDLTLSKSKLDEYLIDLTANLDAKRFQMTEEEKAELAKMKEQIMMQQMQGGAKPVPSQQSPGQEFANANNL